MNATAGECHRVPHMTLPSMHATAGEISCLHVSELCDFVITGNDDGTIRLWNPDSGSTISLVGHTNTVTCLEVATRGNCELLLSTGYDGV
jgi:WD40 repeat protein